MGTNRIHISPIRTMLVNKIVVNLNVHGAGMKNWISWHKSSTNVYTMNHYWIRENLNPKKLRSIRSKCAILKTLVAIYTSMKLNWVPRKHNNHLFSNNHHRLHAKSMSKKALSSLEDHLRKDCS